MPYVTLYKIILKSIQCYCYKITQTQESIYRDPEILLNFDSPSPLQNHCAVEVNYLKYL